MPYNALNVGEPLHTFVVIKQSYGLTFQQGLLELQCSFSPFRIKLWLSNLAITVTGEFVCYDFCKCSSKQMCIWNPLNILVCPYIQFKVCEWQSRWHSQDLALPATRMEKRCFGHGCKAAWVRELCIFIFNFSEFRLIKVWCDFPLLPAVPSLMGTIKPNWWWQWWPGTVQTALSLRQCQTTCSKCGAPPLDNCCMFCLWVDEAVVVIVLLLWIFIFFKKQSEIDLQAKKNVSCR